MAPPGQLFGDLAGAGLEELLEPVHVLLEHPEGVEAAVHAQLDRGVPEVRLGHLPADPGERGAIVLGRGPLAAVVVDAAEEDGTDGGDGLGIHPAHVVAVHHEAGLRDAVAVAEVDGVAVVRVLRVGVEGGAVEARGDGEGPRLLPRRFEALGHRLQLGLVVERVDRPHEVHGIGVAEAVAPVLRRAGIDVADLRGSGRRAVAELLREGGEPVLSQAEGTEAGRRHADVEAGGRLGPVVPHLGGGDRRRAVGTGEGRPEEGAGGGGIFDPDDQVPDEAHVVAAEDVALDVGEDRPVGIVDADPGRQCRGLGGRLAHRLHQLTNRS